MDRFPGGSDGTGSTCDSGDLGSIPGLGRFLGGGHGNPLQYTCQGNPMDREAWRATVHKVAQSWTQLKQLSTHAFSPQAEMREGGHGRGLAPQGPSSRAHLHTHCSASPWLAANASDCTPRNSDHTSPRKYCAGIHTETWAYDKADLLLKSCFF